ncbi:hypothetical protein BC937DRAFT_94908 [Endogone sp. FLAS-F59071]|nr:hypothetical protein BC937DRAFT_94908 [Endogone sp. FLAS-F59071]|eukprot:RUS20571.1 hypothetical protein BC937DRAFT_94908 [Endogone sp. FLAS-F59071]
MIPNSLTETISCDLGMVEYRLYATVHRTGTLVMNLHARRDIIVLRVPDHLASDAAPESSMTVIRESEWCDWSLTIERIPVTAGTPLCVVGRVVAIKKGIRIESLSVTISEKRKICASEVRASRVEEKRLRLVCTDAHKSDRIGVELDETGGVWEERAAFDTPNCNDKLHHTTVYPNILVSHWVRVTLTVSMVEEPESEGSGNKGKSTKKEKRSYREYLLDSPIQILDCRCVDDFIALPVYSAVMGQITPEGFRCPCGDEYRNIKQKGLLPENFEYVAVGDREAPPPPNYEDVIGPWNSSDEGETGVWKNIEQEDS